MRAGVFAKRAGTNLFLGRYDTAMADALESRTGEASDWKAYFTAGRAAYGLCEYQTCRKHLESALELKPDASGPKKELARCLVRLEEEEQGKFDFQTMFASLNPQHVHLDCASFLSNTRVASSKLHGNGLFVTRDIKAGELVFAEKAMFMPNQYEPRRASAALYATMVHQLYENPSLADTLLRLYDGGYDRSGLEGTIVDGVPIVDVFVVEGIRTKNCFSAPLSTFEDTKPGTPAGRFAKGLWAHSSYMNHSCVPNTLRSFLGDMLISRATRDIAKGEEIFQQYVPVKALPEVRLKQYQEGWGFECQCRLCEGEKLSPAAAKAKRKEVLAAVEKACLKKRPGKGLVPESSIRNIERMMRQLEDLHEPHIYDSLPRLTLIFPTNYLIEAHQGRKNHAKVVRYARKLLRNFGFEAPDGDENEAWDPMSIYGKSEMVRLMTIHVVTSLRHLHGAYKALGELDMAKRCDEAARFGYGMITGFESDVNKLDE